jgi:hypothetical protein
VRLFLERANNYLYPNRRGVLIADRPGGGQEDEDRFLGRCLDTIRTGTRYVDPPSVVVPVCQRRM